MASLTQIAVVLLAILACCSRVDSQASTPSVVATRGSFIRWNKWLEKFIDDDDPEENLAAALHKFGRMKKSEIDTLGQAIDLLRIVSEAKECDDTVVKALEKIAAGANPTFVQNRIDKVANFYVGKIYKQCEKFLLEKLSRLEAESSNGGEQIDVFLKTMIPIQLKNIDTNLSEEDKNKLYQSLAEEDTLASILDLTGKDLASNLRLLSKADPRCVFKSEQAPLSSNQDENQADMRGQKLALSSVNQANFRYAFNKYLVEPCRFYDKVFGSYFDQFYALKSINPELKLASGEQPRVGSALTTNPLLLNDLPNEWFVSLFRSKMCTRTLNMSMEKLREISFELQHI